MRGSRKWPNNSYILRFVGKKMVCKNVSVFHLKMASTNVLLCSSHYVPSFQEHAELNQKNIFFITVLAFFKEEAHLFYFLCFQPASGFWYIPVWNSWVIQESYRLLKRRQHWAWSHVCRSLKFFPTKLTVEIYIYWEWVGKKQPFVTMFSPVAFNHDNWFTKAIYQ